MRWTDGRAGQRTHELTLALLELAHDQDRERTRSRLNTGQPRRSRRHAQPVGGFCEFDDGLSQAVHDEREFRWLRNVGAHRSRLGEATKPTASTRLVLICGLPASGKSTLARQLADRIPAIRLDKDQWTTDLGHDVWDDEFRVRVEAQLWALTQELLVNGQSVILEWGHWARVERDEKRLRARALGVAVELHYLDAPLDELIERAERRTASGEWRASPMTRAHFEQWATTFQAPAADELHLFDKPIVEA